MSEKAQNLLKQLLDLKHPVKSGVVKSVNLENLTCDVDPDDEGAELPNVRLRAVEISGAALASP